MREQPTRKRGPRPLEPAFRLLLHLFPREFRREHGKEWLEMARASTTIALLKDTARALPLVWRQEWTTPTTRGRGTPNMLDALRTDLRFAYRTLWKNPGFSVVALLTLGLGIGANTAVFSVVNGVLLDPLPYPDPDGLMAVWMTEESEGDLETPWSVPRLREAMAEARSFQSVSGYTWEDATLTGRGDPELVYAVSVTHGLLTTLGTPPSLGRDIRPEETLPGGPLVTVISHSFWTEKLGSDPEALGQLLKLSGRSYEIVGVAPPGFAFPSRARLWIPGQWSEEEYGRDRHFLRAVGRLQPGVRPGAAQEEMNALAVGMQERDSGWDPEVGIHLQSLTEATVGDVRLGLLVLLGAVGMVLLIACANVANLLLARGASRAGEMAVRSTLGAGRGVLTRQLMTESLVLAVGAGALGVLLSIWGIQGLKALSPRGLPRLDNVGVDASILLFAGAISLAVAIAFGLAPAIRQSRISIAGVIRGGGEEKRRGRGGEMARSGLLVGEVALSLALLLGAGLLLKSFAQINSVELGYDAGRVQQFNLSLPASTYDQAASVAFYRTLEERLSALPGVETAGMGSGSPLGRSHATISFTIPGQPAPTRETQPLALVRIATPGFLPALGIPLVRGRGIEPSDLADTPRVALISSTTAARFWPDEDPIGEQISFDDAEPAWTVVGVVGDVRSLDVTTESEPEIYFPHTQWTRNTMTVEVLHSGQTAGLDAALRGVVRELDPNLAVYWMESLQDRVDASVSSERFYMLMVGAAAALAVVLAAIGLFGVVAFLVSRRTKEIGIRIAVGARGGDVVGMVVKQSFPPVILGIGLGLGLALVGGRVLSSLLYQVRPWDIQTLLAGSLLFLVVALGAALVPAQWAARIPPTEAMKAE
jgi:putative ABC transport system permease protein